MDTYGIDPLSLTGIKCLYTEMKAQVKKKMSLRSEATFVKENHILSIERVTCLIQVCSNPKVDLKPEFVFKSKGTRTHLTLLQGVNCQWPPKGLALSRY